MNFRKKKSSPPLTVYSKYPMIILNSISLSPSDTLNIADSAKVAIKQFAGDFAQNPSGVLTSLVESGIGFGLKVLAAIAIYIIGAWLIKRIGKIINSIFVKKGTEKAIVTFVNSLVSISLTIILIIITISALGINTTSIAAILAAGGMAIGMALGGTVQNFAGGVMILVFKPFKTGDYIKAQGYEGYITEINIVSTKIRTYENSVIIMPNGALFNGNIDNFSHNPLHRVAWSVNVSYGTEFKLVKDTLLDILRSDERIITTGEAPEPSVNLSGMKDSSIEFSAKAWAKVEDYWSVLYDINEKIYTTLTQKGIQIPFPQLDVHLIDKS